MSVDKLKSSITDNWSETPIKQICFDILDKLSKLKDLDVIITFTDLIDMIEESGFTSRDFHACLAILAQSNNAIFNSILTYSTNESVTVLDAKQIRDVMEKDSFILKGKLIVDASNKCSPAFILKDETKKEFKSNDS